MKPKRSAHDTTLQSSSNGSSNAMPPGVASSGERLHADWSTDENKRTDL